FPVYRVLRAIGEFDANSILNVDTSNELAAVGIALRKADRMRVLVGNLTGEEQTVTLRGLDEKSVDYQVLGANVSQAAPELAITLPPYGVAMIDRVDD
ncbi:MAG: hypothetical protein KDB27_03215, partial [Planctomycetales bacterium]|nr:hypothetical protein [Planctomycetales bacterium]